MTCSGRQPHYSFDLYVKGEVPESLGGSIVVTLARRHKNRGIYSRWHDSQTDLMRMDLFPGRPGRIQVTVLGVDPSGADLGDGFCPTPYERTAFGADPAYGYATQPNHGVNVAGDTVWATNLLYGAPLELELSTFEPRRLLRVVEPCQERPRVSSTSHFAYSLDGRHAYFHQSLMERETADQPVRAVDLKLVEVDVASGGQHVWSILPPPEDDLPEAANFHSAFYFEEECQGYVGLLRTGARVETMAPLPTPAGSGPMPRSTIWTIRLDRTRATLEARLLPGVEELDGLALSHLDVDNSSGDGFVLFANFKEAAVGDETKGVNVYGEEQSDVLEHYAGMIVEALNVGQVIRYEKRGAEIDIKTFKRAYDPGATSKGHTWLPINIELDRGRNFLFCTFSGFHPRLLPRHMAATYRDRVVDPMGIRYVPSLLMRFRADTLEPDEGPDRDYLSYTEPAAMCVVGDVGSGYVCTFSPERGLRVYPSEDLSRMVCHAESIDLRYWQDDCFRPDPAHMMFVPR